MHKSVGEYLFRNNAVTVGKCQHRHQLCLQIRREPRVRLGRYISRLKCPFPADYASVAICRDLDPASIMHALRTRSVYATSGVRIWLRLWVEGVPMGGVVRADGRLRAEVEIRAGAAIGRACLVLPGAELDLDAGGAADWEGHVDVDAVRPGFVYLRVVRSDGECAWSSPVFLDAEV